MKFTAAAELYFFFLFNCHIRLLRFLRSQLCLSLLAGKRIRKDIIVTRVALMQVLFGPF